MRTDAAERIRLARQALQLGASPGEVSRYLSWQDFEALCAEVLEASGYWVRRRMRLRTPRIEIDILAINASLAVAVDCKHWTASAAGSSLREAVRQQLHRAVILAELHPSVLPGVNRIVPVIVTLVDSALRSLHGVPVVPVDRFNQFIQQLPGYLDQFRVVEV